jgi:hypothetical protein
MPVKDVAAKYGISPARAHQVAVTACDVLRVNMSGHPSMVGLAIQRMHQPYDPCTPEAFHLELAAERENEWHDWRLLRFNSFN